MIRWALYQEPHRHYKHLKDDGKWSWSVGGQRIISVTTVLDGGQDNLTRWAIGQTLLAAEETMHDWYGVPHRNDSVLSFGELAGLNPNMAEAVRDSKGAVGTDSHVYLAKCLEAQYDVLPVVGDVPYGVVYAIDAWIAEAEPEPVEDEHGPRVERCVGDPETAVAGTYDAQVTLADGVHRLDLKTSRTVQPKHWAQVAEYERLAVLNGESESDWLSILHVDDAGNFRLLSIAACGPKAALAAAVFKAHLTILRGSAKLSALCKTTPDKD